MSIIIFLCGVIMLYINSGRRYNSENINMACIIIGVSLMCGLAEIFFWIGKYF